MKIKIYIENLNFQKTCSAIGDNKQKPPLLLQHLIVYRVSQSIELCCNPATTLSTERAVGRVCVCVCVAYVCVHV